MLNAAGSATPQALGTAAAGTSTAYSREDHVHAIPTLSGDVTNDGASVTVAKLQSSPVASTTPASGQVLTWDGAQWAPATNSSGGGGGANGLTYYLNQGTAADAPTTGITGTPHQLGRTGESGQTTVTTGTMTQNVWTLVAGFVSESTPIDPDVTLIPAGLWDFNIWAYGDANSNAGTSIRCRVYKYNGSTLTEIASPSSDQVINGTSAQYSLSVLVPQTTLELTDRIYVAIEARATASGHSITAQFGDSTPSHVHTSLPLVGGTGLWKSVAGVLQAPASLLINADVDAAAGIAWSKIAPSYLGARVKVVGRDAATIQGCIDLCTDADGEHPYTVLIPPIAGSYSESLTLKGSVSLVGLTAPLNADAVQITGTHTFAPASAQANTNRINFQNLTFISGSTDSNTITCSSSTKYFSKLTFSGCIFSGNKADNYSHLKTDDNVAVYVDNCRFESSAGGSASAGITQGNGPLYLSNNTMFDVSGLAINVPVATFPVTRTATVTGGVGGTTTMTLTSGDITGLAVGMKISGVNLGTTVTVVSLTAPSTVVMSTTPKTSGSFTATFGQTPYVEIHDSVLAGKGAQTVRLGNGLLTCNTSNFTNTASGGSGINMLTANTVVGIINSSFTIADAAAYTITAAAATCYAALNSVSFSNSFLATYSTLIGANVTVADYSARATSIENGGTGAITAAAALTNLGAVPSADLVTTATANKVPKLNASGFLSTTQLATISGLPTAAIGSLAYIPTITVDTKGRVTALTSAALSNLTTAQLGCLTTAATANLVPQLTTSGFLSTTQLATVAGLPATAIGSSTIVPTITVDTKGRVTVLATTALSGLTTAQLGCLTTAATANLVPQLTTSGLISLTQLGAIGTTQLGCLTTGQIASLVPQLNASGQIYTSQIATLNQNTTGSAGKATNLIGGNSTTLLGSVPYQSNTDATTLLAPNTTATKKFLRQTGTGTNGAAPAWDTIVAADVPTLNQNTTGTAANVTGTVALGNGGTGATTAQTGLNALAGGATPITAGSGKALISNGSNVVFGQLNLTTATGITGILPVENGGTGYYFPNIGALANVTGINNIPAGTPYSMLYDDSYIIWVAGAGATTITLYDLTTAPYNTGTMFRIVNKSTGTVTVKLFGGTTLCTIATLNSREFIVGPNTSNTADNVAFLPTQTTTV